MPTFVYNGIDAKKAFEHQSKFLRPKTIVPNKGREEVIAFETKKAMAELEELKRSLKESLEKDAELDGVGEYMFPRGKPVAVKDEDREIVEKLRALCKGGMYSEVTGEPKRGPGRPPKAKDNEQPDPS